MPDQTTIRHLVQQLLHADHLGEQEVDALLSQLEALVPHPAVSDLIYHTDLTLTKSWSRL